jgi:hypothetical protein
VTDRRGDVVVGQWPNPALAVWLAARAATWAGVGDAELGRTLDGVARGALIVWGLDELVRGASPFRRLLGAVVLGWQLAGLLG